MIAQASDWTWVLNQGLAVGIIISIGYCGYHGCKWCATNLFLPLKDAAVTHLETVGVTLTDASESLKKINTKLDTVNDRTTELIKAHEGFFTESIQDRKELRESLVHVSDRIDRLEERNV